MKKRKFVLIWQTAESLVIQSVFDNLSQLIGGLNYCNNSNATVISVLGIDPDIFPDKL